MKKVYSISNALLLSAGMSSAAVAAPEFYVGGLVGYQDTSVELSDSDSSSFTGATEKSSWKEDGYSVSGAAGSLVAGVKIPFSNGFFTSFEANVGTSNAEAEFSNSYNYSEDIGYRESGSESQTLEAGNSYGISVLAGLDVTQKTSIYGRLGYQRTNYEYKGSAGFQDNQGYSSGASYSEDETFGGVRYGVGMETEISDLLALRLDWSQTQYSSESFGSNDNDFDVEPTESLFQAGVIFKF